ncbi:MAG: ABC transporter ATP-binding protein [Marinilabiliales bacterium]|nr:ABC transporter ATP-binding protein [Marinilabiliales bacterium]
MKREITVACRGLSIGFRGHHNPKVIAGAMDLEACQGELVALIGGNGIGKSTLLKTLAGFLPRLEGEIRIGQQQLDHYSASDKARWISFVSTESTVVANLKVRELVSLGRYPYTGWFGRLDEADHQMVEWAIEMVGLKGFGERFVNQLSDGERQRAMIGRALAQDTPLMILDEPTAFLDIAGRLDVVSLLHQLADEKGKCILFSTHDLQIALSTADRIWMMSPQGILEGIPEEVVASGRLERLFAHNSQLNFDPERGEFRVRKKFRGIARLASAVGGNPLVRTALERSGFEVENDLTPEDTDWVTSHPDPVSPPVLHIDGCDGEWKIRFEGKEVSADSIGGLCYAAKMLIRQPGS